MEKIFPYLFKISCDYTSLPLFSKNALVQEYVGDALMYRNIVKLFILSCFLSLVVFLILLSQGNKSRVYFLYFVKKRLFE